MYRFVLRRNMKMFVAEFFVALLICASGLRHRSCDVNADEVSPTIGRGENGSIRKSEKNVSANSIAAKRQDQRDSNSLLSRNASNQVGQAGPKNVNLGPASREKNPAV